jgi:diguanylate cyclase (GGDEF)-like protein
MTAERDVCRMQDLPESSKWPPTRHVWPLLAVASLGLAVAVAAWFAVAGWEERLAKAKFNDIAGDYSTVLQNGVDHYVGEIAAIRAFYDASVNVDAREFELFTNRILRGHASLQRITWSPLVTRDQRAAFEREQRARGLKDFAIRSWSLSGPGKVEQQRDVYFPVQYATGPSQRSSLIGMDLHSEPVRRSTIQRALKAHRMAAAQNVIIREPGGDEQRGLFVALPVYRGTEQDGVGAASQLRGVLTGAFRTEAMIDAILARAPLPRSVDLYLYTANANANASPVYAREVPSGRPVSVAPAVKSVVQALPHWSAPVKIGDAFWDLYVAPSDGGSISYYRAWLVFALTLLVFGAALAYMWASLRHALRLERANTRILQLAQTDNLTTLANRRAFMKRLNMAFAGSLRGAPPFAVLYLDIDDFKDVNDTLGHAMGDELLKEVVERLKLVVREEDLVARFGGDEFAILSGNVSDPADAGALAARIGEVLGHPFMIDGHKISVTSSIGIAMFSRDIAGPEAMMVQADLALYGAKDEGRNCYRFHSEDLDRQVHERVRVADELRAAIENDELELYYQPQVELATGRITGLEALIRWNHKTRGLLTPASFIPIAERTGAVLPLGNWVFDEACRQFNVWRAEGIAPKVLAVNVSGVQLKGASDLEREIEESLVKWNINPGDIELELTESVLMEATQRHSNTLENLRRMGTKIAIDDFGTGYSSLKYLTTYPVNRLKLAQEFVFRVTVDYRNAAVVRAAIRLAHELGLDVIAEGVETEAQMRFLIGAGCEQAQGYYFSRPVKADKATALLREGRVIPAPAPQHRFTSAA